MKSRASAVLALALLALGALLVAAHLLLVWQIMRAPKVDVYIPGLVGIPVFATFVTVGALVISRHLRHRLGWLLCLSGLIWQAFALIDS